MRIHIPGFQRCCAIPLVSIALVLSAGCASTPPKPYTPIHSAADTRTDSKTKPSQPSASATLAKTFEEAEKRGDEAWAAGEADMAVYLYIQALSFRPRDINTLGKIGSIEQAQGNLMLAARAFELAANTDQSDPRLSGRFGLILLALGDEEKAAPWLRRSVETASTDWRVLDGLCVIETRQGHYPAALQYSGEAVALAPGMAVPLLHRAQALYGSGNQIGAEDALRMSLKLNNMPEAWRLLGQIQAKRRAYAESLASFLQALDAPEAYNTVGKLAMDNSDNAIALGYFEKASTASPVYLVEAQRNAALARERLGALRQ
jgi:tetratricopeptide (TPR) repeat protein